MTSNVHFNVPQEGELQYSETIFGSEDLQGSQIRKWNFPVFVHLLTELRYNPSRI